MPTDVTLLQMAEVIDQGNSIVGVLKSTFGKNSINRMAKQSMLQTPVIGDNSIDKQTLTVITKCIERRTAAILMSVFSMNPFISLKKFGSIGNYIRSYYDNEKSPIALPGAEGFIGVDDESFIEVTEAVIYAPHTVKVDPQIQYECLIGTEAALNMTDLNDIYNPAVGNITQLRKALYAAESVGKPTPRPVEPKDPVQTHHRTRTPNPGSTVNGPVNNNGTPTPNAPQDPNQVPTKFGKMLVPKSSINGPVTSDGTPVVGVFSDITNAITASTPAYEADSLSVGGTGVTPYTQSLIGENGKRAGNANGSIAVQTAAGINNRLKDNSLHANTRPKVGRTGKVEVSESKGSFDPTILNVTFTIDHGEKNTNSTQQTVAIGIQAVLRTLRFEDVIETLCTASKGSVEAFKMVRYLTGERNFADFLLGVADAKQVARPKTVGEKVLANLRRRKMDRKFKNASGGVKPLPITWLVVSQAAVDEVKNRTGIDLGEAYFATKLMQEYYFLGFMIVDESMDLVKSILDGDSTFTETTIRSLVNSNQHKYDLSDIKAINSLISGKL